MAGDAGREGDARVTSSPPPGWRCCATGCSAAWTASRPTGSGPRARSGELLDAISAYRSFFVGRDPQAPAGVWDGSRYHLRFPDGTQRPVDAPDEPVVPIPVVLAPAAAPGGVRPARLARPATGAALAAEHRG